MRISQEKCDRIYSCLDEIKSPKYIPYKHDVLALEELIKNNPTEKETFIAYLIYTSEYSVKDKNTEDKIKFIRNYLYKNLKILG